MTQAMSAHKDRGEAFLCGIRSHPEPLWSIYFPGSSPEEIQLARTSRDRAAPNHTLLYSQEIEK
jgi:hypothetical protein